MNRIKILLIIIFGLFLLTGCDNNTAIAAEDFVDYMEQNEYQTTNVISQFSNYPQIKNYIIYFFFILWLYISINCCII